MSGGPSPGRPLPQGTAGSGSGRRERPGAARRTDRCQPANSSRCPEGGCWFPKRQDAAAEMRQTITGRQIKECRVDSLLIQAGRKAPEVMRKVAVLSYKDLNTTQVDQARR